MPTGLLKVREVAAATYLSTATVRRKIAAGELDAVRLGPRSLRVWADSVARLLVSGYDAGTGGDR